MDDFVMAMGWAIQVENDIDLRTVGPTKQSALVNSLLVHFGIMANNDWTEEYIHSAWLQQSSAACDLNLRLIPVIVGSAGASA